MMKKRFPAAVFLLVAIALSDCHRARKIEGQVFVVTEGGQSIKLGLVEVFAYNRGEVDQAIKKVDERLKKSREGSHVISDAANKFAKRASATERTTFENTLHGYNGANIAAHEEAQSLESDLKDFQHLLERRQNYLFSSQPYFAALSTPVARAKTDADGNFVISVPLLGQFVIGARAQRSVGDEIEHYAWLVTTDRASSQKLTLSNDNLTSAGGENSLLKTKGDENDAEDISKEQAEAVLTQIAAKHPQINLEEKVPSQQPETQPVPFQAQRWATLGVEVPLQTPSGQVIYLPIGTRLEFVSREGSEIRIRYAGTEYLIPAAFAPVIQ